ncbi:MAG: ATP-binding protein [Actinobacteria bacterium]|nr:ATP-binding protein [Actinomycetota bacterium]
MSRKSALRRRMVPVALVNADATHIEATIGNDPGEIAPVREAVHELAERAGYGKRADDLALAVDELIANAQEHGAAPIHVVAAADGDSGVHVEVSDAGSGFDWSEAVREHPPRPDSRRGRGLWIVRQLVDRVTVERDGDDATRIRIVLQQAA